ncbi:hypothetical protein FJY94_04380 [Candidatus Kaiserbacteria bacterium]|nr:hypothetical protein [Candidatus Kaiserbacteria bacterium]
MLSWTSYGAHRAVLNDGLGNVAVTGSLTVRPESSRNYVLTVYGYNGQVTTCNTYLAVSGAAPFVSLSQIPYTGFDFGTFGNTMYWFAIMAFALAASYLVLYHRGGAMHLMTNVGLANPRVRRQASVVATGPIAHAPEVPVAEAPVFKLPAINTHAGVTVDTMSVVDNAGNDMPRIVINRS